LLIISHTPLVAHFFLRAHIEGLKETFNVIVAHNNKIDTYCPDVSDLCQVANISIQRRFGFWQDIIAMFQLTMLISRYKPEIVLSIAPKPGLLGMFIARVFRVNIRLHIFQGEVWPNRVGLARKVLKFCDSLIIRNSTHLICVSQSEKQLLESNFVIRPGILNVLGYGTICGVKPNFFSVDKKNVDKNSLSYDLPENSKVCVYLGRICEEKGVNDLINAFCLLDHDSSNKRLVLIGPEEKFSVNEALKNKPENIRKLISVHGFTNQPENILARGDFLCLPSYREGYGLSIIEAAATGIPAVGTRIVGICDAIEENETGLLYEPRNVNELVECLQRMFDDDSLRTKLGENAKRRAEMHFKQAKVVSLYLKFITNIYHQNKI
jgi:glycosyltransferase involved in cell wall biosynthesis